MIIEAVIISRPNSGEYDEKIFDNESVWNSSSWTYVKFTNNDYYEWCGVFRGLPIDVKISEKLNEVVILTSDYLYQLGTENGNLLEATESTGYNIITVAPTGEFVLGYYYYLAKVGKTVKEKIRIESPIQMDSIKFTGWENNKLNFTCEEFTNRERHLQMELDCKTWKINIKNGS